MGIQDLSDQYEAKTDEELLRLALDSKQLTSEASVALDAELARRRIGSSGQLAEFRDEEQQYEVQQATEIGRLFLVHPSGIGRKRFGKAEYIFTAETGMERFKTTVFIVLFWFPLIPTGTYLVERRREFVSAEITVLEKIPLDWEQVLKVWVVAAAGLLSVLWAFKLLVRLG